MTTDIGAEQERLYALTAIEREERANGHKIIAGLDEAGRGPLAGPVVAAACIIPPRIYIEGVDDSKALTPLQRREVYERLIRHPRIFFGIGIVDVETIDAINIYQATVQAMFRAIEALSEKPDILLVDGMKLAHPSIPSRKVIGGDALSQSIAAASIIAKETRDDLMRGYDREWPHYGFAKHKGYGTAFHRLALQTHGPCPLHRRSFEPIKSILECGDLSPLC